MATSSDTEVQPEMNGTPERPKTATSQGSGDHNGEVACSFWEEVQRRRREERQRRQSTSEVQQLLKEVRKERRANPESVQSPTSGSEATGPGSENRAYSFSPPRQASEVEKILAEIRQERCFASPASARPARPAPKAQRVRPKNPPQSEPMPRQKASPVRKQLFKDVKSHSSQSQQLSMTRTFSSSSTSRMESPSRLLELGCLGKGCTGSWSAQLRSYLPSNGTQDEPEADDRFAKTAVQAYPAGGWDSRTSCPRFFDNFPGGVIKRNPNETLPRARSLPRLKASRSRSTSPVSPRQTPENTTELRFKELLKDAQNAVLRATEAALPSKEEVTEISEVVPADVTAE